ncbi:hypothetical protein KFE25_010410 [Diacronema lutheri]|uniref:RING-type domain-containing protein n=1 Tax=Diacronema lutheri TaxID=2081491 RepID=A0A8J5XGM2_DIALT|nr:hypothetical protein KFE25_010410 [Diacronema lutheri]
MTPREERRQLLQGGAPAHALRQADALRARGMAGFTGTEHAYGAHPAGGVLVLHAGRTLEPEPSAPFGSGLLRALCLALSAPFTDAAWHADRAHDRDDGIYALAYARRYRHDEVLPCGLTRHQVRSLEAREITPEDHELLLALDQSVAKKAVLRAEQLPRAIVATTAARRASCAICLEIVEPWQRGAKLRGCGHGPFHRKCLVKWLTDGRDTCPLCNAHVAA